MELFGTTMLVFHILTGYLALLSGAISMVSKKGGNIHKKSGKVFFYSMLGVTISAITLSVVKSNLFLLFIGIFVFQQNFNGWRAVKDKTQRPRWYDWFIMVIAFLNALLMVWTGNLVLVIFGSISLLVTIQHIVLFRGVLNGRKLPPFSGLKRHIGSMMGAYIGTITAFLVVNVDGFEPSWVIWLAPTFILVPLMIYWSRKYSMPGKKIKTANYSSE